MSVRKFASSWSEVNLNMCTSIYIIYTVELIFDHASLIFRRWWCKKATADAEAAESERARQAKKGPRKFSDASLCGFVRKVKAENLFGELKRASEREKGRKMVRVKVEWKIEAEIRFSIINVSLPSSSCCVKQNSFIMKKYVCCMWTK